MFQLIISGISLGSVYCLIAVGFSIVYSNMKFSNFAHGGMISACAYIGYFINIALNKPPIYVTLILTTFCGVAIALILDFCAYRKIRKKQAHNLYYFLSSITFAILIEQILNIYFGKNYYQFPAVFKTTTVSIGPALIGTDNLLILGVSVSIMLILLFLYNKTKIGLAIKTVAINPTTSRLMGIDSGMVIAAVFSIAGALAGISGVLLALKYAVYPSLGQSMVIKGFIACSIGGLGSISGAIIAAILLGIFEMIVTYYCGSLYTPIVLFGAMLLFLVIKPNGISGRFAKEKV